MTETGLARYLESPETGEAVVARILAGLSWYQNIDTDETTELFTGEIYNWFVRECVARNQYLVFTEDSYARIFSLYRDLVFALRKLDAASADGERVRAIVRNHRKRLLAIVSPAEASLGSAGVIVPCAEYTVALQLKVLRLDPASVVGPVLDIGCGEKASLVRKFRALGFVATGIDQYVPPSGDDCVLRRNWLEFDYRKAYWGAVVSHMAFSNHFRRAIAQSEKRPDDDAPRALVSAYRAAFTAILDSLKKGGSFTYTPSVAEAESTVDRSRFTVERFTNVAGSPELDTVRITRLAK
jgi:hypothetical protein